MLLDPRAKLTLASARLGALGHVNILASGGRLEFGHALAGGRGEFGASRKQEREKSKRGQPQKWHGHELAFAGWEERIIVFKIDPPWALWSK